tara:strand:+ start:403 stop:654 length:252 start_codon:yes stop_codon:yes gene_type:complete
MMENLWLNLDIPPESEFRLELMRRTIRGPFTPAELQEQFDECLAHLVHKEWYLKQCIKYIAELEGQQRAGYPFDGLSDAPIKR